MKNYWLISGGILIGYGIKDSTNKAESALEIISGAALILIAIYGFKK